MKKNQEQKQDLLLDALSCIDEDILEKGLALRDQAAAHPKEAPKKPPQEIQPPTFVLSDLDQKPLKRLWRILPVVAAASLLAVVIPLSVLLAAFLLHGDSDAPLPAPGQTDGIGGLFPPMMDAEDGNEAEGTNAISPEEAPATDAPTDAGRDEPATDQLPEWWNPEETAEQETKYPTEPYSPPEWNWNVISHQNKHTNKNMWPELSGLDVYYEYTATVDTFNRGTQEELKAFEEADISPEDELVVDLFARHTLSLYAMDYASYFVLFHPITVEKRFTQKLEWLTYEDRLGRIRTVANRVRPYDSVSTDLTLIENRELTGEMLEGYLLDQAKTIEAEGLSVEKITAVRYFVVKGTVTLGGAFTTEVSTEDVAVYHEGLYCFEYDGIWYLDSVHMEDDLSVDLAQSNLYPNQGYFKTQTKHGTVVDVDDSFLYLDTGHAFLIEDATILLSSGEGERTIRVGDTVTVTHYSLGLEGLSFPIEGARTEYWSLYTATQVDVSE